jgi:ADP-heptose:LPS heptosyltransferase
LSESISANWFRDVVEPLADSFEAAAVNRYVELFTTAIGRPELRSRYERIRVKKRFEGADPADVFVLSRVTLGADVAITSVVMDGVRRRFPAARIWFVGPRKNFELFEAHGGIGHVELPYRRLGTAAERLAASEQLRGLVDREGAIVVDPDSRLTQLGLIPVCDPERYYFFESRSAQEAGSLSWLTARWMEHTFGVADARAFVAPRPVSGEPAGITVSLGVGENPAKRVCGPFERELMERLASTGRSIVIDKGAGGDETRRVEAAIAGLPNVRTWEGAFAPFAAQIAGSRLYIGYDSAGQHVAAACGVPLITVFAGFPNERFFERWRPYGPGRIDVIRVDTPDPARVLEDVAGLIDPRP